MKTRDHSYSADPGPLDRAVLGVMLRFGAYAIVAMVAMMLLQSLGALVAFEELTTRAAAALMTATGLSVIREGTLIHLGARTLSVDLACTAAYVAALYCALVLAYPVPWRTRCLGIAAGVPVILLANLARLLATGHAATLSAAPFDVLHDYLFQAGMVIVTAVAWALWLSYARRHAL